MTWGEIKRKIEALGVQDEDDVLYVDVSTDLTDEIRATRESGAWEIRS